MAKWTLRQRLSTAPAASWEFRPVARPRQKLPFATAKQGARAFVLLPTRKLRSCVKFHESYKFQTRPSIPLPPFPCPIPGWAKEWTQGNERRMAYEVVLIARGAPSAGHGNLAGTLLARRFPPRRRKGIVAAGGWASKTLPRLPHRPAWMLPRGESAGCSCQSCSCRNLRGSA